MKQRLFKFKRKRGNTAMSRLLPCLVRKAMTVCIVPQDPCGEWLASLVPSRHLARLMRFGRLPENRTNSSPLAAADSTLLDDVDLNAIQLRRVATGKEMLQLMGGIISNPTLQFWSSEMNRRGQQTAPSLQFLASQLCKIVEEEGPHAQHESILLIRIAASLATAATEEDMALLSQAHRSAALLLDTLWTRCRADDDLDELLIVTEHLTTAATAMELPGASFVRKHWLRAAAGRNHAATPRLSLFYSVALVHLAALVHAEGDTSDFVTSTNQLVSSALRLAGCADAVAALEVQRKAEAWGLKGIVDTDALIVRLRGCLSTEKSLPPELLARAVSLLMGHDRVDQFVEDMLVRLKEAIFNDNAIDTIDWECLWSSLWEYFDLPSSETWSPGVVTLVGDCLDRVVSCSKVPSLMCAEVLQTRLSNVRSRDGRSWKVEESIVSVGVRICRNGAWSIPLSGDGSGSRMLIVELQASSATRLQLVPSDILANIRWAALRTETEGDTATRLQRALKHPNDPLFAMRAAVDIGSSSFISGAWRATALTQLLQHCHGTATQWLPVLFSHFAVSPLVTGVPVPHWIPRHVPPIVLLELLEVVMSIVKQSDLNRACYSLIITALTEAVSTQPEVTVEDILCAVVLLEHHKICNERRLLTALAEALMARRLEVSVRQAALAHGFFGLLQCPDLLPSLVDANDERTHDYDEEDA